jgi:hypothetical protein
MHFHYFNSTNFILFGVFWCFIPTHLHCFIVAFTCSIFGLMMFFLVVVLLVHATKSKQVVVAKHCRRHQASNHHEIMVTVLKFFLSSLKIQSLLYVLRLILIHVDFLPLIFFSMVNMLSFCIY